MGEIVHVSPDTRSMWDQSVAKATMSNNIDAFGVDVLQMGANDVRDVEGQRRRLIKGTAAF